MSFLTLLEDIAERQGVSIEELKDCIKVETIKSKWDSQIKLPGYKLNQRIINGELTIFYRDFADKFHESMGIGFNTKSWGKVKPNSYGEGINFRAALARFKLIDHMYNTNLL